MATKFVEQIQLADANARQWLVENTKNPLTVDWDKEEEMAPITVVCFTGWDNEPIEVDVTKIQGLHIWGLDEFGNDVDFDGESWADGVASHLADFFSRFC